MKKKIITTKPIVVFYHADCLDGFTAVWVAWKKFGNKAEYIPTYFHNELSNLKGKEIYMLDVVFEGKGEIEHLMKNNKRVTVIDHHISAKDITLSTNEPSFDLNHSGCVLAWKYFFPSKPLPLFLRYIEDVDIWKLKLKNSKALSLYLDLCDYNFNLWSKLIKDFENSSKRKDILEKGALLMEREKRKISQHISYNAKLVSLDGYRIYAMNTDRSTSLTGHELCKLKPPFSIIWHESKDGFVHVSLRGIGSIDCSKIAKKHGGGGHKYSAAFRLKSIKDIPWKNI